MNTLTGQIYGYPATQSGDEISCSFSLPPAGSLLLFIPNTGREALPVPSVPENMSPVQSSSPVNVARDEDNALLIDFCDLELDGEITKDLNIFDAADKVFRHYGFTTAIHGIHRYSSGQILLTGILSVSIPDSLQHIILQ